MTRGNLPPSSDLFIGRETEVDRIVELCQTGSTMVTLQGLVVLARHNWPFSRLITWGSDSRADCGLSIYQRRQP